MRSSIVTRTPSAPAANWGPPQSRTVSSGRETGLQAAASIDVQAAGCTGSRQSSGSLSSVPNIIRLPSASGANACTDAPWPSSTSTSDHERPSPESHRRGSGRASGLGRYPRLAECHERPVPGRDVMNSGNRLTAVEGAGKLPSSDRSRGRHRRRLGRRLCRRDRRRIRSDGRFRGLRLLAVREQRGGGVGRGGRTAGDKLLRLSHHARDEEGGEHEQPGDGDRQERASMPHDEGSHCSEIHRAGSSGVPLGALGDAESPL